MVCYFDAKKIRQKNERTNDHPNIKKKKMYDDRRNNTNNAVYSIVLWVEGGRKRERERERESIDE